MNKWLQFDSLDEILGIIPSESSQGSREVAHRDQKSDENQGEIWAELNLPKLKNKK